MTLIPAHIRALVGKTLAEKVARYPTVADLDNLLAGFAMTRREPPREVVEAVARRRAELRKGTK